MIIKKNLLLVSLASLTLTGAAIAETAVKKEIKDALKSGELKTDLKVRYIDTFTAMRNSDIGKEEAEKLEQTAKEKTAAVQATGQQVAKRVKEYEVKAPTMSEDARKKEEEYLIAAKRDYEHERKSAEEDMKMASQRATEKLLKDLEQAVYEIARVEKLDAVIDGATGKVIFASENADYTAKIVSKMNKQREVKLASTSKKPATTKVASAKTTKKGVKA